MLAACFKAFIVDINITMLCTTITITDCNISRLQFYVVSAN